MVPEGPITREQLLEWYRMMRLIRRMEELAAKAYTLKKIKGFCHLYIGQEAVCVGATAALNPDDYVIAAYREHGQILARGVDPGAVMAELFGKATGLCHGVGGSMHLVSKEHNFWGGYGIVGGHVPLCTGAAFAAKYSGNGRVAMVYFGDGAAQQGAFFEALELAQLWKLPADLPLREQLLRDGHQPGAPVLPHRHVAARRRRGHEALAVRGLRRGQRLPQRQARGRPRPQRARPRHPRGDHLPLPGPLDVRPGEVPG
jgi:hypothetical protein